MGEKAYIKLKNEYEILQKKLIEIEKQQSDKTDHLSHTKSIEGNFKNRMSQLNQRENTELNNERLESLLRISQFPKNDVQELLDFALEEAIQLTRSKIGYIYFYKEEARQFILNTWSKEVMKECNVIDPQTVYDLDKTGIWGEAVRQRKPILVNDFPAENPLKRGMPEGHVKLIKFLTIPVFVDKKIVAVVGVANKETDYDNSDIRQLTLLMDSVWRISERIRLIDELKKAKDKAEENELLLNLILENSPILMFIKDEKLKTKRLSKNFESLVGMPVEQMLGKTNSDIFPGDFGKKIDEDDLKILNENKVTEIEEEFNNRYYSTIKFPVQIIDKINYLAGFTIDITERKLAEKALKDSEERWKFSVEGARDGLWDWNLETNEVFFSPQWKYMLGYHDDEIKNDISEWSKRVHPEDIEKSYADIQLHLDGKVDHYSNIHRVLCKDGNYKWILDRGKIISYNQYGKAVRMIGTHTDLTERMQVEEALKLSESKSKAIIQAMPDMMFVHDSEGTILDYYFPADTARFSPPVITSGQKIENIFSEDIFNEVKPIIKKAIDTKEVQFHEFSLKLPDGEHFYESRSICFDSVKVLSIVRDITKRHIAEETIKQQNIELTKLNRDKDRFISVLAHDLKNPFSTILGFLELLNRNLYKYDIEQIASQLNIIDGMAQKTYDMLIDLLQWAKSQSNQLKLEPESIQLYELCKEVLDSLNVQAKNKGILLLNNVEDNTQITADPILIQGIIRNLASNAIKFSFENGQVKVGSESDESQVIITVSDHGVGIPKVNLNKIWDKSQPFSTQGTAKEVGTGLGLLLCHEFVELHGGKIWVESEVGKGSRFMFSIPRKFQVT